MSLFKKSSNDVKNINCNDDMHLATGLVQSSSEIGGGGGEGGGVRSIVVSGIGALGSNLTRTSGGGGGEIGLGLIISLGSALGSNFTCKSGDDDDDNGGGDGGGFSSRSCSTGLFLAGKCTWWVSGGGEEGLEELVSDSSFSRSGSESNLT
mmetsp:Transcript_10805/g.16600  ORF Transcript_10805/g.16600 Transcript_10805/m.16600 type:complete len:151 (+) Transcript_10805:100-552(+)